MSVTTEGITLLYTFLSVWLDDCQLYLPSACSDIVMRLQ